MAGMPAFHAMSRSLLDLADRKTPGSMNANASGSERSPRPARTLATTRCFHHFLSTVALLVGAFIAFAQPAHGAFLGMPLAGGALGVQTHGEVLELNYAIQVSPAVVIQPELEYFV